MVGTIVGCYQMQVLSGDVEGNIRKLETIMPELNGAGCRLVLLPEMWSCGFFYPKLTEMARLSPFVLEKLQKLAQKYTITLVGSLPEELPRGICNTSYVIDELGTILGRYRKIHLFSLTGEDRYFLAGERACVFDTSIGRLGVGICYDLRFPELARKLALDGADILCFSALWPVPRIQHWSLLLRSRAIENQLFVMGCNGSGSDGNTKYGGSSAIVSPTGRVLAEAGEAEGWIVAELDFAEMYEFRKHISCFADRRPQAYGTT